MSALRLAGIAALAVTLLAGMPLAAQTAHFNSAIRTLGSGFYYPFGLAVDANGNIFVAGGYGNDVKEILAVNGAIPANPVIRTLGSGFYEPFSIAVDRHGNVFVIEPYRFDLKEILAINGTIPENPTIVTIASGFVHPFGVAVDHNDNVFVADYGASAIKKFLAVGGYTTMVTLGTGYWANNMWVDTSGNLFFADLNGDAVREMLASSNYTTVITLAGGFNHPDGVAVDANGNVFVADTLNHAVKEILAVNGSIPPNPIIITLGGGFYKPWAVAAGANGNVFVADTFNSAVKEISAAGGNFGAVNAGSPASSPISLYFTFDTAGTLGSTAVLTQGAPGLDFADTGDGTCKSGTAYNADDMCSVNVTFKPTAPGPRSGAVQLLDSSGHLLAAGYVQGVGIGPLVNFLPGTQSTLGGGFNWPTGVATDANGNVFVADGANNAVKEILAAGGYVTVNTLSGFSSPIGVAVDGNGNVFVAECGSNAVKMILAVNGSIPPNPTVITLGSGFNGPRGVAVDGSGNVFVADYGNNAVKEILSAGSYTTVNTLASGLNLPTGVAVDASGNVFVADAGNSAVRQILAVNGSIPANPTILTLGSGFFIPTGVAVDGSGNVFVADRSNNAVKKILAVNGSIPPNPSILSLGSGFNYVTGVAVDANGNVFVADTFNNRVEKLDYVDPPALHFADTAVGMRSIDSPQTVSVWNNGNADLTFPVPATGNNPSISSGFTLDNATTCPQSSPSSSAAGALAPGASCDYAVDFVPAAVGANSGSLLLTDNDRNAAPPRYATQSISLKGAGLGPIATLAPGQVTFSPQLAGTTSAPQTVTLSNSGSSLTISGIAISGPNAADFTQTNACGMSLAGGASCQIQVIFKPSIGGTESATLTVTDDSGGSAGATQTVSLSGTGQDFTLTASTSALIIRAGQPANVTLQLTPLGGWTGSVSLDCSGEPLNATYSFTPSQLVVAGSNPVTATMTIKTAARGITIPPIPQLPNTPLWPLSLGLAAALLAATALARMQRFRPQPAAAALLLALALALTSVSCASSQHGTPAGTYSLTITAQSGSLSHQVTVNLTVQ